MPKRKKPLSSPQVRKLIKYHSIQASRITGSCSSLNNSTTTFDSSLLANSSSSRALGKYPFNQSSPVQKNDIIIINENALPKTHQRIVESYSNTGNIPEEVTTNPVAKTITFEQRNNSSSADRLVFNFPNRLIDTPSKPPTSNFPLPGSVNVGKSPSEIHLIQSSPTLVKGNSTELEVDSAFLSCEYVNQDELLRAQNVYRNLFGESPTASNNSSLINFKDKESFISGTSSKLNNFESRDSSLIKKDEVNYPDLGTWLPPYQEASPVSIKCEGKHELENELENEETPKKRTRKKKRKTLTVKKIRKKLPPTVFVVLKINNQEFLRTLASTYSSSEASNFRSDIYSTGTSTTNSLVTKRESGNNSSLDSDYSPRNRKNNRTRRHTEASEYIPEKKRKLSARSKTGCWTCRIRHKACPEEKPECSQCVRLQLKCDYSEERPPYMYDPVLQDRKLREIREITSAYKKITFGRRKGSECTNSS